jgi:hypothetical protein
MNKQLPSCSISNKTGKAAITNHSASVISKALLLPQCTNVPNILYNPSAFLKLGTRTST